MPWADAVYISQHDDAEKGHQVGQMGRIYRGADSMLVWLGEESDDSQLMANMIVEQVNGEPAVPNEESQD